MNTNTVRALAAALLMGATATVAITLHSTPAYSAAAVRVENKALVDAVQGAQTAAKAGNYADALTKAKAADAIQGKPAQLTQQIHQMIVAYALQAKNYNEYFAQIDKLIAANEGDKSKNLSDALSLSLQLNNQQRVSQYMGLIGSNLNPQTRMVIAQSYIKAKRYKEGLDMVAPLRDMPSEVLLLFLQDTYNQMNDAANRRTTLEQLVANYPKPQYWHDLLQLARNERGLSDEQSMDIYRLRMAVNDLKTLDEYSEMAQIALVAGYPNEAKTVLDKANAAKLLAGERSGRLVTMTNTRVAADAALISDLAKKAPTDPNASVKLGMVYWTYGKYPEAEAAIRNGMKSKLADPEGAKIALGHVLLSTGKRPDAMAQFNSVSRTNPKQAAIARLWSIYSRNEPPRAPATPPPAKRG